MQNVIKDDARKKKEQVSVRKRETNEGVSCLVAIHGTGQYASRRLKQEFYDDSFMLLCWVLHNRRVASFLLHFLNRLDFLYPLYEEYHH